MRAVRGAVRVIGLVVLGAAACRGGPVQAPARAIAAADPAPAAAPVPADTSPPARGEQELQAAIGRDLGDARAWEELAWLYYQRSASEPGHEILAKQVVAQGLAALARSKRTSADLLVTRGLLALADGRLDGARRDFEAALLLAPHHPRALMMVGQLALETREYPRAWQAFDRLRDLRSGRRNPEVWLALGVAERGIGRYDAAEAAYRQAAALAPADPRPAFNNGLLYVARAARDDDMVAVEKYQRVAREHLQGFLAQAQGDPRFTSQRAVAEQLIRELTPRNDGCCRRISKELEARAAELAEERRISEEPERQRVMELERQAMEAEAAESAAGR
jgi:Flp pilus assembly protein TadD